MATLKVAQVRNAGQLTLVPQAHLVRKCRKDETVQGEMCDYYYFYYPCLNLRCARQ
jgi:hypothetical protein